MQRIRLKYTQRPVTEIAFDAGYETHESFTRAFKARFGKAPRLYRSEQPDFGSEIEASLEIVHLPPRRLACVRHVGPYDQTGSAFMTVLEWAGRRGLLPAPSMVGIFWDHQAITPPERARCDVGLFVDEHAEVRERADDAIEVRELPAGDHAVMRCQGSTQQRRRQYDFLYGQWLPERGRVPAMEPPYEEYISPSGDLDHLDSITNVHVLLAPKRGAPRVEGCGAGEASPKRAA